MTEVDFLGKFVFSLKWAKRAQNGVFLSFYEVLLFAGSDLK